MAASAVASEVGGSGVGADWVFVLFRFVFPSRRRDKHPPAVRYPPMQKLN